MKIIPIHYKLSKPVKKYSEIKREAEALVRFIWRGKLEGFYNKAFAIAHAQVSETPYAFFVVSGEVIMEKMFSSQVIINPKILDASPEANMKLRDKEGKVVLDKQISNIVSYDEPCLSFPFRKPKRVDRYNVIKIQYQIPKWNGLYLKTITEDASGIKSQIFQHFTDHCNAKNIYFESESPVKWWELIGTPRDKGGKSIDPFETTKSPVREYPSETIDIKT